MAETATVQASSLMDYHEALAALSPMLRREAEDLYAKATAYVWGFEDASGVRNVRTDHDSWHFANAYGVYAVEFAAGTRRSRSPIAQCFKQWKATGSVLPMEGESWVS